MGGFRSLHALIMSLCGKIPRDLITEQSHDTLEESILNTFYGKAAPAPLAVTAVKPLPEGFTVLTRKPKERIGRVVLEYLLGRGVTYEKIRMCGAGYGTEGPTRGYAVFPITVKGEYVMYTSRRVTGLRSKTLHGGASKSALFNYDNCHEAKRIFIGEGPFDALCLHGNLRPTDGGVATLGTVLHPEQADLLDELPAEELVVYYDADAHAKAVKAAATLKARTSKRISLVHWDGLDPDELSREDLVAAVRGRRPYSEILSAVEQVLKW